MGMFTSQQRPMEINCSSIDPNDESVFYTGDGVSTTWQEGIEARVKLTIIVKTNFV